MTLLCILLKELLGYPKMKIHNKLWRQREKKQYFGGHFSFVLNHYHEDFGVHCLVI